MKTQHSVSTSNSIKKLYLLVLSVTFLLATITANAQTNTQTTLTPLGTTQLLGKVNGVTIEAKVQSPSGQATPLQVICVFEYTEGDIFNSPPALPRNLNGMVHVDEALHGLITDLRKSGKFSGHAYETLLITPPAGTVPAQKLLLIGLGDRNKFNADLMTDIGRIGMREALRLGIASYSHASDLKDAGIDSPTGEVAQNVVKGAMEAYETELYLNGKHAAPKPVVNKITLLAGPAFFVPSGEAIKSFIAAHQ